MGGSIAATTNRGRQRPNHPHPVGEIRKASNFAVFLCTKSQPKATVQSCSNSVFQYAVSTVVRKGIHSRYRRRLNISLLNGVHCGPCGLCTSAIPASSGFCPPLPRVQLLQEPTTFSHAEIPPPQPRLTLPTLHSLPPNHFPPHLH